MAFSDQWTPVRRSGTIRENNDESSEEVRCGGTCGERPVLLFLLLPNGGIQRTRRIRKKADNWTAT